MIERTKRDTGRTCVCALARVLFTRRGKLVQWKWNPVKCLIPVFYLFITREFVWRDVREYKVAVSDFKLESESNRKSRVNLNVT